MHQGKVCNRFDIHSLTSPISGLDIALVIALRLLGDQTDRTAHAVLAEQCALRTAQHLDALKIHQVHRRARETAVVHIIDVDTHSRLEGIVEIDLDQAAQTDCRRGAIVADRLTEVCVRDDTADVIEALEAALLKRFGTQRGQRQRRRLQVLFFEARGDYDLLQVIGTGLICSQARRCRKAQRSGHSQRYGALGCSTNCGPVNPLVNGLHECTLVISCSRCRVS